MIATIKRATLSTFSGCPAFTETGGLIGVRSICNKGQSDSGLRELEGTGFYNTSDGLCHGCLDCYKTGIVRFYKSRIGKKRNSGLGAKAFQADCGSRSHHC